MKITQKEVQYVADLAHLDLSAGERQKMETDLNAILEFVDRLSEVETGAVEPMAQVQDIGMQIPHSDPLRDDELRACLPHELALKNAPQTDGSFFRVPKVIER